MKNTKLGPPNKKRPTFCILSWMLLNGGSVGLYNMWDIAKLFLSFFPFPIPLPLPPSLYHLFTFKEDRPGESVTDYLRKVIEDEPAFWLKPQFNIRLAMCLAD